MSNEIKPEDLEAACTWARQRYGYKFSNRLDDPIIPSCEFSIGGRKVQARLAFIIVNSRLVEVRISSFTKNWSNKPFEAYRADLGLEPGDPPGFQTIPGFDELIKKARQFYPEWRLNRYYAPVAREIYEGFLTQLFPSVEHHEMHTDVSGYDEAIMTRLREMK